MVDGVERDLDWPLVDGDRVEIVARRLRPRAATRPAHSTAHVLAQAVLDLFPGATFGIGPPIEDGFYYDFDLPDGAHVHRRRPRSHRRADARDHRGRSSRSSATRSPRTRREAVRRHKYKLEIITGKAEDPTSGTDAGLVRIYDNPPQLRRPVPRAARAAHRPARSLQAHAGRRRVLARRRAQPDAAAHLRHRVGVREGAERAPAPARGGREARSPHASASSSTCSASRPRSAAASPSSTRRAASVRKLMEDYSPRRARARRLLVRLDPAHREVDAVRDLGPPQLVRRGHVSPDGDGGGDLLPEADELPGAHAHLPVAATVVPRAAAPAVRVRHRLPLRAHRGAARPHPRARHHAGRLAHLLHSRAARRRARVAAAVRAAAAAHLRSQRLRGRARDPAREVRRRTRAVGRSHRGAAPRARDRGHPVRGRRGRGRVLRAEDRRRTCATRSAGAGRCRRCRSTSRSPIGSTSSSSAPTTSAIVRV